MYYGVKPENDLSGALEEHWGGGNTRLLGNLLKDKKFFLEELTPADLGSCLKPSPGVNHVERKLVQIALMAKRQELLPASLCPRM